MFSSKQVLANDLLSVLLLVVLPSRKEGEEGEEVPVLQVEIVPGLLNFYVNCACQFCSSKCIVL